MIYDNKGEFIGYSADDEDLPLVPQTVGEFIDEVYRANQSPRFRACAWHAY